MLLLQWDRDDDDTCVVSIDEDVDVDENDDWDDSRNEVPELEEVAGLRARDWVGDAVW